MGGRWDGGFFLGGGNGGLSRGNIGIPMADSC